MEKNRPNPGDPTTSKPRPDEGDMTPPHGDEVVNQQRNMSRHQPPAADPDNDRPAE